MDFSAASGQEIALQDPSAGPLVAIWNISLSVPAGTLTLGTTAGLAGSGDGTESLSYQGSIAAIDAGLEGLIYTPPPGTALDVALTLDATSVGAAPVQSQVFVTYGPFVVTTTADSGPWSLRQAILDSNGATGATNTIDFDIPGSGVQTIFLLSALPAISNPVLIDGTSQPGYAGSPLIELNGSQAGGGDGLMITSPGVTVAGLNIDSFGQGAGIHLTGSGATGDWIYGDFLGTDPAGTQAEPNQFGVEIDEGASDNLIGTDGDGINDAAERDLISGNSGVGVLIKGQGTDGNVVAGNLIGTTVTGDVALANGAYPYNGSYPYYNYSGPGTAGGVMIVAGASGNVIGTDGVSVDAAGQGNVISGNDNAGVAIGGSSDNVVAGNFIGTDVTGSVSLPNQSGGIVIAEGSTGNTIGGTSAVAGNLITNNGGPGVVVGTSASDLSIGNPITDNRIFANIGQAIDLGDDGVTDNASAPSQGPNNLQNFPILFMTSNGQLEGWLGGSTPDTLFRLDFFASAAYGPGGSGDAQDDLGSIEVTTDATGGVSFAVPFTAPDGLPIITATATDPGGNTSEVSALRPGVFQVPANYVRFTAGQPFVFSAASGDAIALNDPDVGPFDLTWDLTLSVTTGTLTLSNIAGLTGSGNGTNTLSYSGPLSALDAALAGMTFTPPAVSYGYVTLSLDARSDGAASVDSQVLLSNGSFLVTNTADSGPGSLRQAIIDSNNAFGATNTIDFAIPGTGIQTIAPTSALPAATTSVLIDGTSQPGFAGTPLIDLSGQSLAGSDPLTIASAVTVRGVAIGGFGFGASAIPEVLALPSLAFSGSGAGPLSSIDSYRFETIIGEDLTVVVQAQGVTTQLLLLDATGNVLMQSDGLSAAGGDDLINTYVPAGTYSLEVQHFGGAGTFSLTATALAATSPLQPLAMGQSPVDIESIVAGDFTGDGHLDLAFTSSSQFDGTNVVSVLLSNGDGTFAPPVNYAVGSQPWALVAGDFNGDGRLDLAVANDGDNTVSVLMGNGDGTFKAQVNYAVGSNPRAIVAGDLTGDGHLDLAVANYVSGTVSVLLGDGDGTFAPQVTYAVGQRPDAIVAGDFSGDGRLDLAVANWTSPAALTSTVSVLLGDGDGTFAPQVTYAVGILPVSIAAGDFNGDGHVDLAVSDSVGVQILQGHGDGTFLPARTVANGDSGALVAGDFIGDGRIDLAVAYNGFVSVLLGNGDGTFQPEVRYSLGHTLTEIVAGDFNGDGRLDLAVALSYVLGGPRISGVSLLLGYGDGTFLPLGGPTGNTVGTSPGTVVAGDFSGDGRLDLAVVNLGDNTVSVLLGNGDGTFAPQVTYAVGESPAGIVAGDFNGDGRLDLAVANYADNTVSVLLGNGDGTFAPQVTYAVGKSPAGIVAGDFNGDGRTDLALINNGDNTVSVLLNDGDGIFAPQATYAVGTSPNAIVAGDFTGDGRTDLAVANHGNNSVSVLLSHSDGTFAPQVTYAVGTDPDAIVAGDFNGDGRLDLAVANEGLFFSSPGSVSVLLGHGDGTFAPQVTDNLSENAIRMVAGDFNGDGHLDLVLFTEFVYSSSPGIEQAYPISVLLGHGDGTFAPEVTFGNNNNDYLFAITAADFNGDGHLDLAVVYFQARTASVLLGNGDGTFTDADELAATPHATPLVADVNGDGTADVLVVDAAGNILYRQGIPGEPGSFLPPVTVNPGNPSRDIAWLPDTSVGPVLASVDAQDDAISFYAYRDGQFVRLSGSLPTGQFPAQIIAGQLDGNGLDDLVVRNAGDGTVSVYLGSWFRSGFVGPSGTLAAPIFTAAFILPDGLGVSDVQAVDTTGSGVLDLVVTNKLTGQVSLLRNLGGGAFAPLEPYRAGTGFSVIEPGSMPESAGEDATAGVASGPLTPGAPPSLVTINPGTYTIDLLAGLGRGRFANPVTIRTQAPAEVVRMANFTGSGVADLAVLTADGVSIFLGDGQGGFSSPVTYNAGTDPTGLTVTDLLGNGKLDLLIGNIYGDVLILVGNGDGTFRTFEPVKQAIALAVADLTGNGVPDFVFADQSLNQVSVVYGTTSQDDNSPAVIGNQTTGVLAPGAVLLKDLNGDGIPDLIVANSGGNNVLVYPGLGNGQFGPPVGGTKGFPVGTDPTGLTVANLNGQPDLLVADTGSNDVSVLLGQGSGSSWTMFPGPRVQTDAGPVAMAVGNLLGDTQPDLAVANSGANNVQVFPGVGSGFFNDQPTKTYAVGQAPSSLFLGNFNGLGQGLATLNSGSNDGTLISGIGSANPVTQSFPTGGDSPTTGFAGDFTGNGFTDLVVGNNGDGHLALLTGGLGGLSLFQTLSSAEVPNPTALSFGGVSDGLLSFYVSTAGHEAATNLTFNLSGGPESGESGGGVPSVVVTPTEGSSAGVLSQATSGSVQQVSQLLSLSGTTLDLAATLLSVSVVEIESGGGTSGAGGSTGPGQGSSQANDSSSDSGDEPSDEAKPDDGVSQTIVERATAWERLVLGLERSWERARAVILEVDGRSPAAENRKATVPPATGRTLAPPVPTPARPTTRDRTGAQARPAASSEAAIVAPLLPVVASSIPGPEGTGRVIDTVLGELGAGREADRPGWGFWDELARAQDTDRTRPVVAVVASAVVVGAGWTLGRKAIRRRRSVAIHLH